jgi:hypothetical protein
LGVVEHLWLRFQRRQLRFRPAIADPTLLNFDEGSDLRCIAKSGS